MCVSVFSDSAKLGSIGIHIIPNFIQQDSTNDLQSSVKKYRFKNRFLIELRHPVDSSCDTLACLVRRTLAWVAAGAPSYPTPSTTPSSRQFVAAVKYAGVTSGVLVSCLFRCFLGSLDAKCSPPLKMRDGVVNHSSR